MQWVVRPLYSVIEPDPEGPGSLRGEGRAGGAQEAEWVF